MSSSIEQAAQAFAKGLSARTSNSHTDGTKYVLHRSVIARKLSHGDQHVVRFDWCGYHTPTTANHMNAILRAIGSDPRVSYAQARDGKSDEVFDISMKGTP